MPTNSASVTVVNLQKLKYTPMMNGITNPMMNAANVGSANSAHHFRIALPAMLIIACPLSSFSVPHIATARCGIPAFVTLIGDSQLRSSPFLGFHSP